MAPRFLGVDFSGAKFPDDKIWVAEVEAAEEGSGGLRLVSLRNGFSWRRLVEHLLAAAQRPGGGRALMDFPFGLAALTARNLGVSSAMPSSLFEAVAACGGPEEFRRRGRGGIEGTGSEVAHKRRVDRLTHTPFAAINHRLYRQTYRGMVEVLLPLARAGASIAPWSLGDFWIGESCPSSVLRDLTGERPVGYKLSQNPDPPAERTRREHYLKILRRHFGIAVPKCRQIQMVDDPGGDALDAFVLAAAASAVGTAEAAESQAHVGRHPTEAWVYLGGYRPEPAP